MSKLYSINHNHKSLQRLITFCFQLITIWKTLPHLLNFDIVYVLALAKVVRGRWPHWNCPALHCRVSVPRLQQPLMNCDLSLTRGWANRTVGERARDWDMCTAGTPGQKPHWKWLCLQLPRCPCKESLRQHSAHQTPLSKEITITRTSTNTD